MLATALTTVTSFQMIFFREDNEAFWTVIVIFWIEVFHYMGICAQRYQLESILQYGIEGVYSSMLSSVAINFPSFIK